MKSAMSNAVSENFRILLWYLVAILAIVHADQFNHGDTARSIYMSGGSPMAKGGWRPIMSSDTLSAYNFANILGTQTQTVNHKILTGPALIETKVISPHIVNVSPFTSDIFSSGIISTSTRPIVTRDTNKLTTIAQAYKTSIYPQSGLNLNAPINSYMNPFALPSGPGLSSYKLGPGFQYDNTMFLKHQQQPMLNHRPLYNKIPGQMLLGKRLKHNQMQNHMLQQLSNNNYYQPIQTYQSNMKKPDAYQRPVEYNKRPGENFNKQNNINNQKHVNPHESLQTQTKTKTQSGHNIAAVTYKPPYTTHFQQFGVKEEQFGPIPSSILGSFSSFGHASMKARDPITNPNKNNYSPSTTTKAPYLSTEVYSALSTEISKVKVLPQESKLNVSAKQAVNSKKYSDYSANLTPPPHVPNQPSYNFKDNIPTGSKLDVKSNTKGNFIPSPPDPLSKNQNAPEILKPQYSKLKQSEQYTYNTNLPTKRPEVSSFFEPISTANPFSSESTNAVPENLLVQLPPPYVKNAFNGQPLKVEKVPVKESYQSKHTSNFNSYEDVQYFPPTAGHEFFGSKYNKNQEVKDKNQYKGSYEVTETWGSSGETNTQPTLHTWIGPAQSYNQYSAGLKPPPPSFNVRPTHEDRLIPLSFSPIHSKFSENKKPTYPDVSSVYSTINDNNKQKTYFTQLENAIEADIKKKKPMGDEEFDLAAPVNVTYKAEERPKTTTTTTPAYVEEITTEQYYVKKRIPSRNKFNYDTTTEAPAEDDFLDFTTRFETFKEQLAETENDLHQNELPTLAPNRHFKRPLITTPVYNENNDDSIAKKKNKNRRRRPSYKTSTTTDSQEDVTFTDPPVRTNRYRTTVSPDIEEVTKIPKPKVRFSQHRTRLTTRPTNQSELTSSAQPTMIPTVPVTFRPRLHSRIRVTTLSPLDFDDSMETTTIRAYKYFENKQSSIMKIAKDANRGTSSKYNSMKVVPDYSHKQDEKDTPTSDIAINTYSHKYSAQTLKNEAATDLPMNEGSDDAEANLISELNVEYTSPSNLDDIGISTKESQTMRSEQLFTEQKLGHRGNTKVDDNSANKKDPLQQQESISDEIKIASTTSTSVNKLIRQKSPGKYDSNRPRFSVKDYRNRLNQYSSTTTERPSHTSESSVANSRLRFPNRSRFPSFKDQYGDSKAAGSILSTTTELPRKKFTPKDPRHRDSAENEEVEDQEKAETIEKSPLENEIASKSVPKMRPGLRRDPNRIRLPSTPEPMVDGSDKITHKPININTYTNLKRPTVNIRKRLFNKNATVDASEHNATDVTSSSSTSTDMSNESDDKNETSTEKYTSETAIMKIAKDEKKHSTFEDHTENSSLNQSQRVSDLTLAASKEYNSSGLFKSVSPNTRRVPNYFTIATDDPILPIEAFFPQLNQKKDI